MTYYPSKLLTEIAKSPSATAAMEELAESLNPTPAPAPAYVPAPIPEPESDDHAVLAAWYSGFPYSEHYRKVVLAQCREIVRAQFAAKNEKVTESRLDDLARTHPNYLDYLARHLQGRIKWEAAYREMGGLA